MGFFFLSVSEIQFDGEPGEIAKDACAEFCNHQKLALEQLKVCNQQTSSHLSWYLSWYLFLLLGQV